VPAEAILEKAASHTLENLSFVRDSWRQHGWRSVLLVPSFHLARAVAYARGLGSVAVAGRRCQPARPARRGRALREAFFLHWYHVGVAARA
jgi:uncharacterized SAM-binding protein YcdF (DUF218 family)